MIPSAETFGAMVVGLNEALVGVETALDMGEVGLAQTLVRAAKANATALSHMAQDLLGEDDFEDPEAKPATDDPATCGHPDTFDLPGQEMCKTCGASRLPDGEWVVL